MPFAFKRRGEEGLVISPTIKGQRTSRSQLVNRGIGIGYIGLMVVLPILAISSQALGEALSCARFRTRVPRRVRESIPSNPSLGWA